MKICPIGAELLHADGWTDRRDEANSHFSQCMYIPGTLCNVIECIT